MNEIVKKVMSVRGSGNYWVWHMEKKKIHFSTTDKWKESTMKLLAAVVNKKL